MLNKFTIQKSFAINAGAGSGKTYTLSRRYINAILGFDFFREDGFDDLYYDDLKPATPKQIVTITYTEAAALEMKERIFGLISKIINHENLNDKDGDKESIDKALDSLDLYQKEYVFDILEKAITQSSDAKISTIHSYCLDILKTNADVARFDSSVDIVKDDEKDKIIKEAIFQTLNDKNNGVTIQEISKYLNLFFLDSIFRMYATSNTFRTSFIAFDNHSITQDTLKTVIHDLYKLPDVSDDLSFVIKSFDEENLEQKYKDFLTAYVKSFSNFEAVSWSELSKEYEVAIQFNRRPFTGMKHLKENIDNIKALDGFCTIYKSIDQNKEELFYKKIDLLKSLMIQIKSIYDAKLKELGKLDFDEIISKTHEIISKVNLDIKYMMVDEFQDTNSIQYDIVKNSLDKDSNLFVVGDSKQSIYSFQGAEIEVFNDAINDKNNIGSIEDMDVNYRSDGEVLQNVNKIFEKLLMPNEDIKIVKQNYEASPQALKVSKEEKASKGSFNFLISTKEYGNNDTDVSEYKKIAQFIANIKYGKLSQYAHIKKLIEENKKAIAVVFDSTTRMLELKSYLQEYNIECKVSASENFYATKEVNDIFNLLMAMQFPNDKFYKTAALRSGILRYTDNDIYQIISKDQKCEELEDLRVEFNQKLLSEFILDIYQRYSFKQIQEYFSDSEQKIANLDKFLFKAIEHENINGNDTYDFLKQIEKNIYFSDAKEDEAFFKSDNLESVQLCTIHSTKGLAYPMVIVANSDKNIYSQIQSDSIKSNSFTLSDNQKKLITGFKVDDYDPLSFRVLKQIDKLKHLAEKKRLLYVALTRAEHDVVISGSIKIKSDGAFNISEASYLGMIVEGLDIDTNKLINHELSNSIKDLKDIDVQKEEKKIENIEVTLKPLKFERVSKPKSATQNNENKSISTTNSDATRLGTITHKIFELYWDKFDEIDISDIYEKFELEGPSEENKIKSSIDKFKSSNVFELLQNGIEHRFELEFNVNEKTGYIDLVYYDQDSNGWVIVDFKTGKPTKEKENKYQQQLDFYKNILESLDMNVVDKRILWV